MTASRGRGITGGISRSWQRLAARAGAALPAPLAWEALSESRARAASGLLARRRTDVERVREALREAAPDDDEPREALARLADDLVGSLRREVAMAEGAPGWLRLAGRLDAMLHTDEEEWLDQPAFDERRRTAALRGIDDQNRRFGSYALFTDLLRPLLADAAGPLTVLDVASGHGGFALALAELAPRPLRVIASDVRGEYLDIGRRQARDAGLSEGSVEFRELDALHLRAALPAGGVDVITCTQTLHHFGAGGTARLLAEALACARRGVLFVDLARAFTHVLGAIPLALSTLDPVLVHDGITSFRKAFVPEEIWLIAACVPGGDRVECFYQAPGFTVLRSR